jgi:hypothetical protein
MVEADVDVLEEDEVEVEGPHGPAFLIHCILCGAISRVEDLDGGGTELQCPRYAEHHFGIALEAPDEAERHDPNEWSVTIAWPA